MLDKANLNKLINQSVFFIDNMLNTKQYPQKLLNYLYLITVGMIINYEDEFIDDIYKTILFTNFNLDKDQYNKSLNTFNKNDKYYFNPTNHNYLSKWLDLNVNFPTIKIQYELLYKDIDNSNIKTLEYLTHELNYILFNKNKKYSIKNKLKIRFDYFKTGLIEENDELENNTIDRVFNILQVEDIIKTILSLRNSKIKNTKFKNALDMLNNIDYNCYKVEGLDILVNLFRPLYNYEETKLLINKNILNDNNLIEKEFDKVLGKNTYKNICQKLDSLDEIINKTKDGLLTNYYALSLEYVAIRNDFINKYIFKKYLEVI